MQFEFMSVLIPVKNPRLQYS